MADIIQWCQDNWAVITTVVLLVVRIIESIIQATATDADDKIWAKVKKIIGIFFKLS